jgi:hypothetical protein
MLTIIDCVIEDQWESMSPSTNRDQHAKKAIEWLFSRMVKNFEFVNRMMANGNLEFFTKYTAGIHKKGIEKALNMAYKLNDALKEKWDETAVNDSLMHAVKWIKEFSQIVFDQEKKEKAIKNLPPPPPPKEEKPEEETPQEVVKQEEEVSDAMRLLQKKMDAFQYLVAKRDYQKAAVVADDIERLIEQFNPLIYLPKVFTRHFSLYAKVSTSLDDNRDGGSFRILEKLYQTNLEAFLEWKG